MFSKREQIQSGVNSAPVLGIVTPISAVPNLFLVNATIAFEKAPKWRSDCN